MKNFVKGIMALAIFGTISFTFNLDKVEATEISDSDSAISVIDETEVESAELNLTTDSETLDLARVVPLRQPPPPPPHRPGPPPPDYHHRPGPLPPDYHHRLGPPPPSYRHPPGPPPPPHRPAPRPRW